MTTKGMTVADNDTWKVREDWNSRRTLANLGGATTIAAGTANLLLTVEGDTTATTAAGVCLLDALTKARGTLGLHR